MAQYRDNTTVKELIQLLSTYNPDANVLVETSTAVFDVSDVEEEDGDVILILGEVEV